MPSVILQHPSAPVTLQDPREQSVVPKEAALSALKAAHLELQQAVRDMAHQEDTCAACGHPTIDHFGGCALAIRSHKPMQTSYPMGVLYGDPHRAVTEAITVALEDACGPAVAVLFEALGNDERLMVARQLSRVAVSAHLQEMAK